MFAGFELVALRRSLFAFGLALLIVLPGCDAKPVAPAGKSPETGGESATGGESPAKDTTAGKQSTEHILGSAVYQLQPENLGIDSDLDSAVSMLNSWQVLADDNPAAPPLPTVEGLPEGFLPAEFVATLGEKRFTPLDASYIRTCFLAHTIAGYLSDRSDNELQRVVLLFEFVCRNIALNDDPTSAPLLLPYDIVLSGRGTAADRAWVLATLLRQWRMDAVVIRPAEADAEEDAWLLGVPVDGQTYLFDLTLGLPIPAEEAPTTVHPRMPATLANIVQHPEWLTALAARADQPYRLEAEQLKQPRIELISDFNSWTRRMWELEQVLPGDQLCVLFDSLVDTPTQPGLFQRIESAGVPKPASGWQLWAHPLQTVAQQRQLTPEQQQQMMSQVHLPFMTPFGYEVDQTGRPTVLPPEKQQLRVRTNQLMGNFAEATTGYLGIRVVGLKPFPDPQIQQVHQISADDAFYWSAVGKYELGEYAEAVESLADYSRRTATRQRWQPAARHLLSWAHAELGQYEEAIKVLARPIGDDAYRPANAVLGRRWAALKK